MFSFLISLLSFAFLITVLVFIHELGHYLAARSVGMRVEKFSVGFPPRFVSFTSVPGGWNFRLFFYKKNEDGKLVWSSVFQKFISSKGKKGSGTEYCLALLPLGGYVKVSGILDESMDPNSTGADYEYQSKKTWQKLWFTSAGVIFNFILAFLILGFIYIYSGYPQNKIGFVQEEFGDIPIEKIEVNGLPLEEKESFLIDVTYQANTDYSDTINGFIKVDNKSANLVFKNLTEKKIDILSFKLPSSITKIDSIPSEYSNQISIDVKENIVEIKPINNSDVLNKPFIEFAKIYHNEITHNKTPAFEAGIQRGDRIISVENKKVKYARDIVDIISSGTKNLNFEFERNGNIHSAQIKPLFYQEYDIYGEKNNKSRIGVIFSPEKLDFFEAISVASYETLNSERIGLTTTVKNIFYLITGRLSLDLMSGPVGIAKISGEVSSNEGFLGLLWLMAALSISLGVINILPFPGLDGGHALIAIIEKLKGGKLSAKVQVRIQQIGMLMLMSLFAYIIFKDLWKLF